MELRYVSLRYEKPKNGPDIVTRTLCSTQRQEIHL
jgi:hypothetical protein